VIDRETLSLAAGAGVIAFSHAVLPTHWLPFALMGRAQRWGRARLVSITALAAAGHALVTAVVGGAFAGAGRGLRAALGDREWIGGAALIAFGIIYAWRDLRHVGHRHVHHVHDGEIHDAAHHRASVSDRSAIVTLVLALALSPCVALSGIFFKAGELGLGATVTVALVNAGLTVAVMPLMVLLASAGLERLHLERIERYERAIVGVLLVALGAVVLFLEHD
jgi:hypothetical protein